MDFITVVVTPAGALLGAVSLGFGIYAMLHGGGFAGTIQAYVPEAMTEKYIAGMESLFGTGCSMRIAIRRLPVSRLI